MERDPFGGGSDVGVDHARDLGDEPPVLDPRRGPRRPGAHRPGRAGQRPPARAGGHHLDRGLARTRLVAGPRPSSSPRSARSGPRASRSIPSSARRCSPMRPRATPSRSSMSVRRSCPVVYVIPADGFDIVVNGDHVLSWGIEPHELQDAALANLAAWSAQAAVDRRVIGRPSARQLGDRRRPGRRPDPAARSRRAPARDAGRGADHGRRPGAAPADRGPAASR